MHLLGPYEMSHDSGFALIPCLGCGSRVKSGERYVVAQELGRDGWQYQVWHVRCPGGVVEPPAVATYQLEPEE